MLIKFFNSVVSEPETYSTKMVLQADNTAELTFTKKMAFKEVSMLTCDFDTESDDLAKMHIRHRHTVAKLEMEQA